MNSPAILAAKQQLDYWKTELANARELGDAEHIARCEAFIAQCEMIVEALDYAIFHQPAQ